jgi:hypothetical protein
MQRRRPLVLFLCLVSLGALAIGSRPSLALADLPSKLTDQEFWSLTDDLSEPNGSFRSDNFLSNETGYQRVIPDLERGAKAGGVYLGVGPEQNFPYIIATRPRMAFIIDIRRGNLHEHLLYKALFEMSADRAEFLSRLFSRKQPAGLTAASTLAETFAAYDKVAPTEDLYKENLRAVTDWLTKKHAFKLSADDVAGVDYVYHTAFYGGGPQLTYAMAGNGGGFGGRGGGGQPTYEQLMLGDDGTGRNRGFLATEENFALVKTLETSNLLVPVVGNFGGPRAIRAVGKYVKDHGATVSAFYLSNVEQYLIQDNIWNNFCASVATLPLDDASTFIYWGRGGPSGGGAAFGRGGGRGMGSTSLRPIQSEVKSCKEGSR